MNRKRTRLLKPSLQHLDDRRVLSAGFLDPTFNVNGVVTTQVGSGADYGHAVTVYPAGTANAGKVVIAGGAVTGNNSVEHFSLVRYNADGSLDPTFGMGGSVVQPIIKAGDAAMAVALAGDKVLVAGDAFLNTASHPDEFAVARFNADGTLDKTFGTNGMVLTAFGKSEDLCAAMAVQPDGKIVLAGTTNAGTGSASTMAFAVARYNPNGTLDTNFGSGGLVTVKVAESLEHDPDRFVDLALSGDQIVLVGSAIYPTRDIYIARLTATGQLDPTFGSGGVAQPGQGQYPQLAAQSDGKLVVSSSFNLSINVTRLLASGATDTGFGTGGTASLPWTVTGVVAESSAISVDPLGRIVIGGFTNPSSGGIGPMLIARFTANGALDSSFGVGGFNTTANTLTAAGGVNSLVGLTLQPDGKALLVGTEVNTWKFAVARFTGDSTLLAAAGFRQQANSVSLTSAKAQPLQHRMDLFTVLEHEIGRLLGKEHEASGVIADTLSAGVWRTPVASSSIDWLAAFDGLFAEASPYKRR
jgi:uncharacterized delta-60 repeat protein